MTNYNDIQIIFRQDLPEGFLLMMEEDRRVMCARCFGDGWEFRGRITQKIRFNIHDETIDRAVGRERLLAEACHFITRGWVTGNIIVNNREAVPVQLNHAVEEEV